MWKKKAREWLAAGVISMVLLFLFLGLAIALDKQGMGSSEAAGWAQALGTVAAIASTFYVVQYQSERARLNAIEMDELNVERKHSALCAILDDAYEQCIRLKALFKDAEEAFGLLSFILVFDERAFDDSIANIERISLHELDSYEVVRAISRMRNRLLSIKGIVKYAMDPTRDQHNDAPDWSVKKHAMDLIADAEAQYLIAMRALGGNFVTNISPFTP